MCAWQRPWQEPPEQGGQLHKHLGGTLITLRNLVECIMNSRRSLRKRRKILSVRNLNHNPGGILCKLGGLGR